MYCITTHAVPNPSGNLDSEAEGARGAYVLSWINFSNEGGAKALSDHYIREAGWIPKEVEKISMPTLEQYQGETEGDRQYFEEALESGFSIVFLLYSEEGESGED